MKTKTVDAKNTGKLAKIKWKLEDQLGLWMHQLMAKLSRDPQVKQLADEMEEALQENRQPQAVRISNQMRSRLIQNSMKKVS